MEAPSSVMSLSDGVSVAVGTAGEDRALEDGLAATPLAMIDGRLVDHHEAVERPRARPVDPPRVDPVVVAHEEVDHRLRPRAEGDVAGSPSSSPSCTGAGTRLCEAPVLPKTTLVLEFPGTHTGPYSSVYVPVRDQYRPIHMGRGSAVGFR